MFALAAAWLSACALGQDGVRGIPESPPDEHGTVSFVLFVCLLLADYMWTFLFIGWPSISATTLRIREMALEIMWLTLWSQPAALVATLLTRLLCHLFGPSGEHGAEVSAPALLLLVHAVLGGAAVGLVIWHFERRRWGLSRGWAWTMTLVGAALLNPASGGYALAYLF